MNGKVFKSDNNILHLTGGTNEVSRLYTPSGFESSINAIGWKQIIDERYRQCSELNCSFRQLIVPEKLSVIDLSDNDKEIVFNASPELESPGGRLVKIINSKRIIYPKNYLVSQSKLYSIYNATDSHWTWTGAFSAFQVLMRDFGFDVEYGAFLRLPRIFHVYHGDLWDKSLNDIGPDRFERLDLPASIRRIYCNSVVGTKERHRATNDIGLHVGSQCVFLNPNAQRRETVILFGTSFSEYRLEPTLLTAIFAYFFETVHFLWSTSIDFGYVERHKADIVVSELPERFLTNCPNDNLEIESFAAERLAAWNKRRLT